MPLEAENTPPVTAELPPIFKLPEFPKSVPLVKVRLLVNVLGPAPRSSVPPDPFIVRPPPVTLPVKRAVPAVLIIETRPVVRNGPMFCAAPPAMITVELPPENVPLLIKSPKNVRPKLAVARVDPEVIFKGTLNEAFPSCLS